MNLHIMYADRTNIFITGNNLIVMYPMNAPITDILYINKKYILEILKDEINDDYSMNKNKLISLFALIKNDNANIINYFKKVQVDEINLDTYNKLEHILNNISIPVIIDLKAIDDEYLLNSINHLDNKLKENNISKMSYVIKQCVDTSESHNEDVSYSLSDVLLVLNYLKDITTNIKKYNFSPLEQVMYIYDLVKNRYYKSEYYHDSYLESRDIARILKGDKIVCMGFAYLFKSLLDTINIPNQLSFIDGINSNIGHVRVFVGIDDDKYNINQVLYFDPTYDSISEKNNNLDKYNNFARNKKYFEIKDKKDDLKDNEYLPFDNNKNYYVHGFDYRDCLLQTKIMFSMINWKKYIENSNLSEDMCNDLKRLISINFVDYFTTDIIEFDKFLYEECSKMIGKSLPADKFLECLINVRKVENTLYPDKFNDNSDKLKEIHEKYISNFDTIINSENNKNEEYNIYKDEKVKEFIKLLNLKR